MSYEKACGQLNALSEVVQQMKEKQEVTAKFTEVQLNKVHKSLDALQKQPSVFSKNAFKAMVSIGNSLQSQSDNLKSGDTLRITTGVLSLVSGVSACFGPSGMALAGITGLAGGVISLFSGTPKPTLTQVIGDMLVQQTQIIGQMLEKLSDHIDSKFNELSDQMSKEFVLLSQSMKKEFEKHQQFIEQQVAQNTSSSAVSVIVEQLNYLNGFLSEYTDLDDEKINKSDSVSRMLSQIKPISNMKEIGIIKSSIERHLNKLNAIGKVQSEKKENDEEVFWELNNYSIQMTVALIHIYTTLCTYRYLVLFQLKCILHSIGDKPNGNGMGKMIDSIKTEAKQLLSFIAKPDINNKYEIIISAYIRSSSNSKLMNAFLNYISDNKLNLLTSIPLNAIKSNAIFAIQNLKNPNHILVTNGIVDESTFISNAVTTIYDASIENYSLYYEIKQNKDEPWKFTLNGHTISYDNGGNKVYLMKEKREDYKNMIMILINGNDKNGFILLDSNNPGKLFKRKKRINDKKIKQNDGKLSFNIVEKFDRKGTRDFINHLDDSVFKLVKPSIKINNIKDILPNAKEEDNDDDNEYKNDNLIIKLSKDKEYKTVDNQIAQQIQKQNERIYRGIIKVIGENGVNGKYFLEQFNKNENTKSGKQLALNIENSVIHLLKVRSEMRSSAQLVFQIMSYKPDIPADNLERKKLWGSITDSCKVIINTITNSLVAGADFWGILMKFAYSFQHFIREQSERKNKNEKLQNMSISMKSLNKDMKEFKKFVSNYQSATKKLHDETTKVMNKFLEDGPMGDKNIKKKQENLVKYRNEYFKEQNNLRIQQIKKNEQLDPIKAKIANYKSSIALDQILIDFADGKIKNFEKAIDTALKLYKEYSSMLKNPNIKDYVIVKSSSGWTGQNKHENKVHTGHRSGLIKEKNSFLKLKDNENANKDKVFAQKEVNEKRKAENQQQLKLKVSDLEQFEKEWDERMKGFEDTMQSKYIQFQDATNQINEAIKKTGQSKEDLVDFLSIAQSLTPANLRGIDYSSRLEVAITTTVDIYVRACELNVSIEDYCLATRQLTSKSEEISKLFLENDYENMADLDYEDDEEEFNKDILEGIIKKSDIKLRRPQIKALTKAALKPEETWVPNIQKIKERDTRDFFLDSFPILLNYVQYAKKIIDNAADQIRIERFVGSDARLKQLQIDNNNKAIEYNSGPIITEVNDHDIKNDH